MEPRALLRRVGRVVGITLLCVLGIVDLAALGAGANGGPWPAVAVVLGLAALLWPARRRPPWLTIEVRACVPAVASLTLTAANHLTDGSMLAGPGEGVALFCLLLVAVRGVRADRLAPVAALVVLAVLALPFRERPVEPDFSDRIGGSVGLAAAAVIFAGLGGYLRAADERRRRRLASLVQARRSERLVMAADLHDFVAHHVTGILVQAQMGQAVLTVQPERLGPILESIERAAGEALASMRRTVDMLRNEPGSADPPRPAGDLAALPELVTGFSVAGPQVTLRTAPEVPADLPHEVQVAVFRVVQEALTNVRRHGADASEVTVDLGHDGRSLNIVVRDDGSRPATGDLARGTGFGLTGLDERVTALGGRLHAGPRPGGGWELTASLPTTRDITT
ncbi:two-component sensor histidine kinase [Actinoplanes italicus]|uniref:histidine kinase n=1 Tax=Actinoplanes italicus TaxID=113567 RepID=A0A2T0KFM8_9ACTN|nr:signal transduction histidine kinase [Actinoplanes italicus]GIE29407.1 two-component sensor histidine kinase [Actinoplanes italicus]